MNPLLLSEKNEGKEGEGSQGSAGGVEGGAESGGVELEEILKVTNKVFLIFFFFNFS